jgi:uncharacterized membrane protein YfcA
VEEVMALLAALFAVGSLAGAIAAVAGFGIGSLLTPLLALATGTTVAVAAVSIPTCSEQPSGSGGSAGMSTVGCSGASG